MRMLRFFGISMLRDLVSSGNVEKSSKKMVHSNALDRTEDDALWEGGDSSCDNNTKSELSISDSDKTTRGRM